MPRLEIRTAGDPVLRAPTRELSPGDLATEEVQRLVDDMIDTMRAKSGAGIAANQVGRSLRLSVIEIRDHNPRYPFLPRIPLTVLVNPRLVALDRSPIESWEGCLSVPGIRGPLRRDTAVRVDFLDRDGHARALEATGMAAIVFQHEVDHLDGRLFIDRVEDPSRLVTAESFDRFVREPFLERVARAALPVAEVREVH